MDKRQCVARNIKCRPPVESRSLLIKLIAHSLLHFYNPTASLGLQRPDNMQIAQIRRKMTGTLHAFVCAKVIGVGNPQLAALPREESSVLTRHPAKQVSQLWHHCRHSQKSQVRVLRTIQNYCAVRTFPNLLYSHQKFVSSLLNVTNITVWFRS
jgi:hypothetical protein